MRALPCGAALSLLSTVLNCGPLAQAASNRTSSQQSFRMLFLLSKFECHRSCRRRVGLFHRQVEAHQPVAGYDEIRLVHVGAFHGEYSIGTAVHRALRKIADLLP